MVLAGKKLAETIKGPLADKDIDENIKGYKRQLEKIREHVGLLGHRAYAQMSANMEGLTTVTVNGFAQTRNDMTSGVEQLHSMMKQLGFVADTNFNKLQSQCDATANLAYMLLQTLNNANCKFFAVKAQRFSKELIRTKEIITADKNLVFFFSIPNQGRDSKRKRTTHAKRNRGHCRPMPLPTAPASCAS
jgi:hypothetical protein